MAIRTIFSKVIYRLCTITTMAFLLGAIVSLLTIAFVDSVSWLNDALLISPHSRIQYQGSGLLVAVTLLVPTVGGLIVGWLFQRHSPEKLPLGPPESIQAVQLRSELPSLRSGLISTLAAIISLGCGASVGQYGPLVYLGSLFGGLITKLQLAIPNLQSIAIASGVSAAIATAFNAPIAGLIFAHEVILRHYSIQTCAPTTVAAATGYVIANVAFERPPLLLVKFSGVIHSYEFGFFALLGLSCAFLATVFMHLILFMTSVGQKLPVAPLYRPAIAGLVLGLVALGLPDVLGLGSEMLRFATIEGAFESQELVLIVFAKLMLTALCVGFGFAGGVFSPSLLIGILFGVLFWSTLEMLGIPNSGVAVYAICGMIALASPVIGAPLTTILIIFELTRNYDLTIAAMIAVVFANLLASRVFGRSLFDIQLARKGIDLSFGRDRAILDNTQVTDYMVNDYLVLETNTPINQAIEMLVNKKHAEAVTIDLSGHYLGMLRLQDALEKAGEESIKTITQQDWPSFNKTTSIWQAMGKLDHFVGEAMPVVSAKDRKLLGMITKTRLIEAYREIIHDLRREENQSI